MDALPRASQLRMRDVRCRCMRCGVHTMARLGYTLGGSCDNCGSYQLEPMAGAPSLAVA